MRTCCTCKRRRPDKFFWVKSRTGRAGMCRECKKEYNRRWYIANKEKHLKDVAKNNRKYHNRNLARRSDTKVCKRCGQRKTLRSFTVVGTDFLLKIASRCRRCRPIERAQRRAIYDKIYQSKYNKAKRRSDRAWAVFRDCIQSDRRHGRQNDLTYEFVKASLLKGCAYCKSSDGKMSLDRIDNSIGHLAYNVNPCCVNCNLTRGNMPYEAWLMISKALRRSRKLGLLNDWVRTKNAAVV
jgi:hypothetical protein